MTTQKPSLTADERRLILEAIDSSPHSDQHKAYLRWNLLGREVGSSPSLRRLSSFKVQDKRTGQFITFVPNRAQTVLLGDILDAWNAKRKFRGIILKARQYGISTGMLILELALANDIDNLPVGIVANEDPVGQDLLSRAKEILRKRDIPIPMRTDNRGELVFHNGSSIIIDSARSGAPMRGRHRRILHCTETAHWTKQQKALLALNQIVPSEPGTALTHESTANGEGDEFHRMWNRAMDGESEYTPYFFPWWFDPEFDYSRAFATVADRQQLLESLTESERHLLLNGVKPEQLNWRRYAIVDLCNASEGDFDQEYPANPEQAFLKIGQPVYAPALVEKARVHVADPIGSYQVSLDDREGVPQVPFKYRLIPDRAGRLSIWEEPCDGGRYVMAVDSAQGLAQDNTVGSVLDLDTGSQVAEWADNRLPPREAAKELMAVAQKYDATLWPEINNPGPVFLELFALMGWRKVMRKVSFKGQSVVWSESEWGWQTNGVSRPIMVAQLKAALADGTIRVRSADCLREIHGLRVKRTEAGTVTHQEGPGLKMDRHDALAIANMAMRFLRGEFGGDEQKEAKRPRWEEEDRLPPLEERHRPPEAEGVLWTDWDRL